MGIRNVADLYQEVCDSRSQLRAEERRVSWQINPWVSFFADGDVQSELERVAERPESVSFREIGLQHWKTGPPRSPLHSAVLRRRSRGRSRAHA